MAWGYDAWGNWVNLPEQQSQAQTIAATLPTYQGAPAAAPAPSGPSNPYFNTIRTPTVQNWGDTPTYDTSYQINPYNGSFRDWVTQYVDPSYRNQFGYGENGQQLNALPSLTRLGKAGYFNQFNLTPEEHEWIGYNVAREQEMTDDHGMSDLQVLSMFLPALGGLYAPAASAATSAGTAGVEALGEEALAALIESGTTGAAGAGLESLAGIMMPGALMPAPLIPSDPTFGGALQNLGPGVSSGGVATQQFGTTASGGGNIGSGMTLENALAQAPTPQTTTDVTAGISSPTESVATTPDAGMDLGMFQETGNPYATGASSPAATAATQQAAAAGGGVTTTGATTAAAGGLGSSALARILDGTGTTADWVSVAGSLAGTGLGIFGANQQANALERIGNQEDARIREMMAFGAPYRSKLADLYTNQGIDNWLKSAEVQTPVQQGSDILARTLSVKGNPANAGFPLQEMQNYATNTLFGRLGQERDRLAGFGGLTQYAGGASQGPNLSPQIAATGARAGGLNAIGAGIADLTRPRTSFEDAMKYFRNLT